MRSSSDSSFSSDSQNESKRSDAERKKKKKSFKNFFKKLKIDKKRKGEKLQSSNSQEEVNRIFDVAKKIVSIFNKVQVVEFLFAAVAGQGVLSHAKANAQIQKEVRAFCKELEEQFYSVMGKLVGFYSQRVSEKSVSGKDAVFLVPSVETCALLNILGRADQAKSTRSSSTTSAPRTTASTWRSSTP